MKTAPGPQNPSVSRHLVVGAHPSPTALHPQCIRVGVSSQAAEVREVQPGGAQHRTGSGWGCQVLTRWPSVGAVVAQVCDRAPSPVVFEGWRN